MTHRQRSRRLADKSKEFDYRTFSNTGKKVQRKRTQTPIDTILSSDEYETCIENQTIEQISDLLTNCQVGDTPVAAIISEETNTNINTVHILDQSVNNQMSSQEANKGAVADEDSSAVSALTDLQVNIESVRQDIEDHLDENRVETFIVVEDIDECIRKIEKLRTHYRNLYNQLKKYVNIDDPENEHCKLYQYTISSIKNHMYAAKNIKSKIRKEESVTHNNEKRIRDEKENEEVTRKVRAAEFLISEVTRMINEVAKEFQKAKNDDVTDEEVMRRNDDLHKNLSEVDKVSSKFQKVLETTPDVYPNSQNIIRNLTENYNILIANKKAYETHLQQQIQKRELLKEKSFKTSYLNIKLKKFKGYSSDIDVYSFQQEFEKLYLKSTPKKMLPDLLKNNYLEDPALALVKTLDKIDEIWTRLKKAYGDSRIMLKKKLTEMKDIAPLWKLKGENLKDGLMNLINFIDDLIKLATAHNIEQKLYNGDGLHIIYGMMGDARVTNWLTSISDEELEDEALWKRLTKYLEKELKVQQEKSLFTKPELPKYTPKDGVRHKSTYYTQKDPRDLKCSFCDEKGHASTNGPNKTPLIQYFACKKFVDMTPEQRYKELCSKGHCVQCLYPGASQKAGKHAYGKCQKDFTCTHASCNTSSMKKHVLVCQEHSQSKENLKVLDDYKSRCILRQKVPLADFSRNIKLSFLAYQASPLNHATQLSPEANDDDVIHDNGIYILQTIQVQNKMFTLFFDTGCSDLVVRHSAIERIGDRGVQEIKGPVMLGGVGETKSESPYGIYQIKLPLHNGKNAVLSGVCLDKITSTFPFYPLDGDVRRDIYHAYKSSGRNISELPSLPKFVGGDVDFMIGAKYLRYHPERIFSLPSGLTIYESPFLNADGSRGVVGGPHAVFSEIERSIHQNQSTVFQVSYLSEQYQLYKMGYQINPDNHLLSIKYGREFDIIHENDIKREEDSYKIRCYAAKKKQKHFNEAENAGSEILYRCVDCRKCGKCRNGEKIELISIKEEVEQDLINKSIHVDIQAGVTTARLPLLDNPVLKLAPNKDKALAVYRNQIKKLNKSEIDKSDVIASEGKLQCLGHVDYVKNLTSDQQKMLSDSPIQNYIPWRSVWNGNSMSTPCRIVYDASQPTSSSYSLNDILPKGRNNMNKLVEIVIRWRGHKHAFHTDVQKMYNTVKLVEEHWCLQRYLWQDQLKADAIPEEKIIKTLIYGVKPSGNQAERGLRNTAEIFKTKYPEVDQIVQKDVYVDDCLSGETTEELAFQRADELTIVLKRGGFGLKGFTFSGRPPLKELSGDGESVNVAGMKWFSESDELKLDVSDLSFAKKYRGKRIKNEDGSKVPEKLTRRHCVSKVAEIFDLTGRITPITAHMKLDLHVLVKRKLDWDDAIPDDLRRVWMSHFDMMKELRHVRFKRAIVPQDAINLDINTIDTGDSSKSIACIAIYARFQKETGDFSCQLIFSRSKILPENITQPRAELLAANLNAHTGEVVKRSFGKYHKSAVKLTDSQIALHWINNKELSLKQWVRNRVIEISRLTDVGNWMFVKSGDMVADIGTRRGATIKDVSPESVWNVGYPWMRKRVSEFPAKTYEKVKLTSNEVSDAGKENFKTECLDETLWPQKTNQQSSSYLITRLSKEISKRYEFSNYIIDPNKHRFKTVVRILAIVQRFIRMCRSKAQKNAKFQPELQNSKKLIKLLKDSDENSNTLILTDNELNDSTNYFYRKATDEVKEFAKSKCYADISEEKDGILYYTGRILPTQEFSAVSTMTEVMKDLAASTFCVPIIDKHSPIAYAVVNEVHWYNKVARHTGVETVLRFTMQFCYILEGRELVKRVRKGCQRCRYLRKRAVGVSMGPVSQYNLTIAPAFYISQIDLAGPFKAYSPHNKRNTIKIYFSVFCCTTTTTVSIKVMEDYSTTAFLQAFVRFSCDVGYPKVLLIDEGSQLVKGCQSMSLNFQDAQHRLHMDMNVEFETCPVGGHNMHGRVERKIRHIKECVETTMQNERLSILQWETLCAEIANSINDLPIAIGSIVSELENIDLLTPNRLKLGRNNDRSPIGPLMVSNNPDKFIQVNKEIFNSWFENWMISHVPKLMTKPKWFKDDDDVKEGDVVLFLKQTDDFAANYQYGMVKSVKKGRDGKIRSADVRYRNHNENFDRTTHRAVRQLVIIHHIDELNILRELGEIATAADAKRKTQIDKDDECDDEI